MTLPTHLLIDQIKIEDRQRKSITPKALEELKRSILSKGLLHAPVVSQNEDGTFSLRAGERRIKAMEALHSEGHSFSYNSTLVEENCTPIVSVSDLSPADLFELELEENLLREDLSWHEECEARVALHKLRKDQNPAQTLKKTGEELAAIRHSNANYEQTKIARAQIILDHKDNPRVSKAKTEEQAFKAILDESEQRFKAKLILLETNNSSKHQILHGDCRKIFSSLSPGSFATIIADPPYGIEANSSGQETKHFYNDGADYALEVCEFILREGFKLCSSRAILFMFCDIDHFTHLRTYASQQAWSVFRTPIIWNKEVSGRAPWGRAGFQRSYEMILFAVKGQDELVNFAGLDILNFKQSNKADRSHGANKPVELLEYLIKISTLPGELILDPCCGSGPIITAANKCNVKTLCIESDETYYAQALNRTTSLPEEGELPL